MGASKVTTLENMKKNAEQVQEFGGWCIKYGITKSDMQLILDLKKIEDGKKKCQYLINHKLDLKDLEEAYIRRNAIWGN